MISFICSVCNPREKWRSALLFLSLVILAVTVPAHAKTVLKLDTSVLEKELPAKPENSAVATDAESEIVYGLPDQIRMFVGDIKLFRMKTPIKTVAVGNGKVLNSSSIDNGDLMILAIDAGDTTVHVWNSMGQHFKARVRVDLKDMDRIGDEVKKALGDTPGLTVRVVGERILIEGQNVTAGTSKMVDSVVKLYPQASNMTTSTAANQLLEPMIRFDLNFIEFKKTALENLGVKWDTQAVNGFNFGYFSDLILSKNAARQLPEGYTTPYPDSTVKEKFSLNALIGVSATINLAISNGDAYVLAAPKLSARSGGKAKFLAGGEIPLKSVGRDGLATIIFKKYGILLDLEANVIGADGISGGVAAEVSSVDYANKVEGLPGFLIRRTESEFNMRDGETLVLSGLIDKANSRIVDKVPLLGNLPIIGEFFRNKQIAGQDSELVVFITPHIYSAQSEINRRAIERGTNGLNKYGTSLGDGNVATDYVEVNKVGPSKQSKQSDNAPAEMKEPASAKE